MGEKIVFDEGKQRVKQQENVDIQRKLPLPMYIDDRPLINDFLRKMAKFRHQENQDVSAGTRIRFFIDKPAAMISFPRAVIKYL